MATTASAALGALTSTQLADLTSKQVQALGTNISVLTNL
jgi:hypothetical protein